MQGFGWYSMLRSVSTDPLKDIEIKKLPAHEVFAFSLYNKLVAEISYKTDIAYQKLAKPK